MGKKKNGKPQSPAEPGLAMTEVWRHPTLVLAMISVALALLSAVLAYQFRDDATMGAIREPTGMILWGAIAVTLTASYWRERSKSRS